jgi:hypothetical protein
MIFRKTSPKEITSEEILSQVSKCDPEDLETFLNQIQTRIENTEDKDWNLLMAKTMITSRLASLRSS